MDGTVMHRELLLLGVLRQGNLHGYGINEFIQRDMAFCTDLKKPTAYHLLQKMAATGWIEEHETQEGNRPTRRMYTITPKGEAEFQRLLRENLGMQISPRFAGDIGLAFVDELPPVEALALLRERRAALRDEQESLEHVQGHAQGGLQLILEHQKRYLAFELAWLDEVMARLSQSAKE
jgi:DNA-binding PadR family transcriptional regulator